MKKIPYAKQLIKKEDIKEVVRTLNSPFITQGPKIDLFEKQLCKKFESRYSVCVNSATSALHLACLSLGLKKGDYLWTASNSFVASSNCALYCDANVDFVDINPSTFNICEFELEKKLRKTPKKKLPKILVLVHFAGNPVNLKFVRQLSKKYKFKIIEDASHAFGAQYKKSKIGSCKYSDITVFSFHPVKIITTAEGGALMTNIKNVYEKLKSLRNHGIEKNVFKIHNQSSKTWKYEQKYLGYNYRMNEIGASLGLSQIKNLEKWILKRNQIAKYYIKNLSNFALNFQKISKYSKSSYHLFVVIFKTKIRNNIYKEMQKNGINVNVHYIPIHTHPYYKKLGFKSNYCPKTIEYYSKCLSLPIYPSLKKKDVDRVINIIKKLLNKK